MLNLYRFQLTLLFFSLLIPLPFFYIEHKISDFIYPKLIVLGLMLISLFFQKRFQTSFFYQLLFLVYIFTFWLIFWAGDPKKIVVIYTLLCPIVYLFFSINIKLRMDDFVKVVSILLVIEVFISLYSFGLTPWKLGPVYIGGHFSNVLIILSFYGFVSKRLRALAWLDLIMGMAGRFLLPVIVAFFKNKFIIVGSFLLLFIYLFTLFWSIYDENYLITAGYRVSEYALTFDALQQCGWLYGCMFEKPFETYQLGTKGLVEVGGHFHNHWLIWTFNFGLCGLLFAIVIYFRMVRLAGIFSSCVFAFVIMMFFDAPRDGHWIVGLVAGVLYNENLLRTKRFI